MAADNPDYTYLAIDGVENCMNTLEDILKGKVHKCFIEMSVCVGSCVGGPAMDKNHRMPVSDYLAVNAYAGKRDFPVEQPEPAALKKNFKYLSVPQANFGSAAIEAARAGAQLRQLRLQYLPRQGSGRPAGQGGSQHVPALLKG